MKTALSLLLTLVLPAVLNAQTPVRRTMALIERSTATWCGPCGGWGWKLHEQIMDEHTTGLPPNAIAVQIHGSRGALGNQTAISLLDSWRMGFIPDWAVNHRSVSAGNAADLDSGQIRVNIRTAVDSLTALDPVASTGFFHSIKGNTLSLATRTQFWKAAEGSYRIAAYLIEDSVYDEQAGRPFFANHHRFVLRDYLGTQLFGEEIVRNSAKADAVFDKSFTYTINDPMWVKSRLSILTVIWKKNGDDWNSYEIVNVNFVPAQATGVKSPEAVDQLLVYPNPAKDFLHFSGLVPGAEAAAVSLIDAAGRLISKVEVGAPGSQLSGRIDLSGIAPGRYFLRISTAAGMSFRPVSVAP